MSRLLLSALFIIVLFPDAKAQMNTISVSPDSTGPGIRIIHGNHFAYSSGSVPSRHRLVLMIQGTGSSAQNLSFFDTMIASMGYPVISLDYPDNVITTVCSNSKDSSCFDGFRQEKSHVRVVVCNQKTLAGVLAVYLWLLCQVV